MTLLNSFDDTPNNTDKSYTVPVSKQWRIMWAHLILTTTSSPGSRQITMEIQDQAKNIIFSINAEVTQAENLTRTYAFLQGGGRSWQPPGGLKSSDIILPPLPEDLYLFPGWKIRFFDNHAVDDTDDLTVSFQYEELVYRVDL